MTSAIMRMTTSIVTSHMSNNKMPSDDVVGFVEGIFKALSRLEDDYLKTHNPDGTPLGHQAGTGPSAEAVEAQPAAAARAVSPPAPTSALRLRKPANQATTDAKIEADADAPTTEAAIPEANVAPPAIEPLSGVVTRRTANSPQITKRDLKDPKGQVKPAQWPGVYSDKIVCLEDKAEVTLLAAYLKNRFKMTFEQYREKWSLPDDYPRTPPAYSESKRNEAKKVGLGSNVRRKKAAPPAKPKSPRRPGTLSPKYG